MVSFNKLTRTLAGIAAAALIVPLAACGGSGNGGTATAEGIPAKGTDDGTEITLWTRSPLERQAKNVVEAYNKSHKNQVKLEIIPNDDMEGKVGGASQTDSLPDILAGDVVRIPYWASEGIFTDITKQIDGLDNKADLQQGHIEAGTVDGAEYTLPFITDVSVMVWNKTLYKEAGLDRARSPSLSSPSRPRRSPPSTRMASQVPTLPVSPVVLWSSTSSRPCGLTANPS